MDTAQFRLPVRIAASGASHIDEIYSAEQALDFLIAWPDRRGRVYDKALKACFGASVDVASADDAQRAFTAFAKLNGFLARDMWPGKWVDDVHGTDKHGRHRAGTSPI